MRTQRGEAQHMAMRDVSTLSWELERRKSEMCDKMIKFIRRRQSKALLSMKILLFTIHFNSLAASSTIWTAHFSSVDASDACHEKRKTLSESVTLEMKRFIKKPLKANELKCELRRGKFQISQSELFGTEKKGKKNVCIKVEWKKVNDSPREKENKSTTSNSRAQAHPAVIKSEWEGSSTSDGWADYVPQENENFFSDGLTMIKTSKRKLNIFFIILHSSPLQSNAIILFWFFSLR